jgi:multidrug resistance efflux pump
LYAVPRLTSYALVLFGIWLILTVMFPTFFTRSTDRAVINSPVSLVTTPVEGIVTGQSAVVGSTFTAGQSLMTLKNPNLDRGLLMELMGKLLDSQQRYDTLKAKLEGDQALLLQTEADIKRYQTTSARDHAGKIRGIQARLAAANQQVAMQQEVVNRNQDMQWVGAVSEAYTSVSRTQLAALTGTRNAIRAELDAAVGNSQSARSKVYTTETDSMVSTLVQKQTELNTEITQLQAEMKQQKEYGESVGKLVSVEQDRLERLSNYDVKAFSTGVVQDVLAPPGTRVSAGATLIRTTNCSESRVVAVFPRSLSNKLLPGTKVMVSVDGASAPQPGSVSEILPRAPDGDQARYFVPFPPIEKNEIYLIAKLDRPMPQIPGATSPSDSCGLGHWARVSLDPWWSGLVAHLR